MNRKRNDYCRMLNIVTCIEHAKINGAFEKLWIQGLKFEFLTQDRTWLINFNQFLTPQHLEGSP